MKKNILIICLFVSSFPLLGCKPTTPPEDAGASTTSEVSSSASGLQEGPCVTSCPTAIPVAGQYCDPVLDQYCEYAGTTCKIANCNAGTAQWEIGDLNPCVCYPGTASSVPTSSLH